MLKDKLLYVHGKPVKFMRFGGLSPVPQKGYNKTNTFHSPPARKGIYAFLWPYIDRFLIGASYSGITTKYSKFTYVKDKDGNPITDTHPEFNNFQDRNKVWQVPTGRDAKEISTGWALIRPKTPKVFTHTGELWHHLSEYLKPNQILAEKNDWIKTTYIDYVFALKKEFHKMAKEPLCSGEKGRWELTNNPTRWWAKDSLEVFIERV